MNGNDLTDRLKTTECNLSIIVPVFNTERYLDRCLDSLLKTTGIVNTEIIVVDDGSTDRSGEIADSYSAKYGFIRCIHKTNGGLSDARNTGLKNAEGKYVFFLDSDDMVIPGSFQKAIEVLETSEADVVLWDGVSINEDDISIESEYDDILVHKGLTANGEYIKGTEAVIRQIVDHGKFSMTAWLMAVKRDYLTDNGLFFETGLLHEDELWTPKVLCGASKVSYLSETVYCYRIREGSIMNFSDDAKEKHAGAVVHIMDELYAFYTDQISDEKQRKIILANWADTYLWEIRQFELNLYDLRKKVPRSKIFGSARGIKHKFMAFGLLVSGVKAFCFAHRIWKKTGKAFSAVKNIFRYAINIRKYQAVMLNSPVYENIGDQAIFVAEEEFCKMNGINMLDCYGAERLVPVYARLTPKNHLVLITGGGNIGGLWMNEELKIRKIIKCFKKQRIIIFPQTVYWNLDTPEGRSCFEESKNCYMSHPDLTLFVRENVSLDFMHKQLPEIRTELVPDMAMLLCPRIDKKRSGVLLCLREDKETILSKTEEDKLIAALKDRYEVKMTDTCFARTVLPEKRRCIIDQKLDCFASSELVITDRLHGMIFAYITNTPCVAIDSLSHKIKGCYEWLKDADNIRLAEDPNDIMKLAEEVYGANSVCDRDKIKKASEPLCRELVRGK